MYVLGITASFHMLYGKNLVLGDVFGLGHDASAALIKDGKVICAMEEERFNRIKHTNKAPITAMKECLLYAKISVDELDAVAVNFMESTINLNLRNSELYNTAWKLENARFYVHSLFQNAFDKDIDDAKIHFVRHHDAHAESAYNMSEFDESLVLVIDGVGDDASGFIQYRNRDQITLLDTYTYENSLGMFYLECIRYLGYKVHDEYKVMGLAPYGDKDKYKKYFKQMVKLLPEGRYAINKTMYSLLFQLGLPRRNNEKFSQLHMDVAAALQAALEGIVEHIVRHHVEKQSVKKLCLAGGVALNCTSNGNLLYKHIVGDLFIQPAAYDAGTSLGAALYVSRQLGIDQYERSQQQHVFYGKEIGSNNEIKKQLQQWEDFICFRKSDDICKEVAGLMAEDKVFGWVQGRSEFGPRALGNRSIVADPRPKKNKDIINRMVKKRESYRPFAPSVLAERVSSYFDLPNQNQNYPFMNVVLKVKEDAGLGAITHIDGTGRVQTVSYDDNPKYWSLISEFEKITGVGVILNTSFNNNAEPIVDSVKDSVVTFLNTELDYVAIGDFLISKKENWKEKIGKLISSIPQQVIIDKQIVFNQNGKQKKIYALCKNYTDQFKRDISRDVYDFLTRCDGMKTTDQILIHMERALEHDLRKEIIQLWEERLIHMDV